MKMLRIRLYVLFYSLFYYKRNTIDFGRLGNRIEIYKTAYRDYHKARVCTILKVIKIS